MNQTHLIHQRSNIQYELKKEHIAKMNIQLEILSFNVFCSLIKAIYKRIY